MEQSVSGVGVLDKAIALLVALQSGPKSLAELVATTGLARATVYRLAAALEIHDLVRRDPEGRFALGFGLAVLGRAAVDAYPLAAVARPILEALRDETGESTQLYVRDGDARVCVVSLESPHGLRTIVPVGAALPLDRGSAGPALLGDREVLARGWSASVGEREAGVASVSAPVVARNGEVVAAVSVSGPIERTTRRPGERYGAAVVNAARQLEASAGFNDRSLPPVEVRSRSGTRRAAPARRGRGA